MLLRPLASLLGLSLALTLSSPAGPQAPEAATHTKGTLPRNLEHPDHPMEPRVFLKTAFRSTIEAAIRQPITTFRLARATYWHRGLVFVQDNVPLPFSLPHRPPPSPGSPEFEKHLDRLGLPSALPGKLSYYVGGTSFFREFEKQLAAAKDSIDLQVFIFDNDDVSVRYADLLRQRARDLPVRVLLDDLGSTFAHGRAPPGGLPEGFIQPKDIGKYLDRDSPLQVRQSLNPWLVTDHTKLMIFDQAHAYLGGMNIGRESRHHWHDLMVGVEGPIVAHLTHDFDRAWEKNGPRGDWTLFEQSPAPELEDAPGIPLRILRTDAVEDRAEILHAMEQAIRGANERIWIETPYFASDGIAKELQLAALRGVDVRVILPDRANHGIMDAGNIVTARHLLQSGVKVYHFPGMTHLKALVCDGWATVGSANLDTISMRINRELNLAYSDPKLVQELVEQVFEPDLKASKLLTLEDTKLFLGPLIESIADQL